MRNNIAGFHSSFERFKQLKGRIFDTILSGALLAESKKYSN